MPIKIALPKGRLLSKTRALLQQANWGMDGYHEKADFYHPESQKFPSLRAKIFHEKDIPIQVAIGNYDLGICGLDWVEELLAKYPSSALVKVKNLGYGQSVLYMTENVSQMVMDGMAGRSHILRIASEYPNLAESFALRNRLGRFSIFPVWGAAEAYPPENADMALISGRSEKDLDNYNLPMASKVLNSSAYLIANKNSWESKDLFEVMTSICDELPPAEAHSASAEEAKISIFSRQYPVAELGGDIINLALPDGHQQQPTLNLLNSAGVQIDDYPSTMGNRRPNIHLKGVTVKVIRPQDMPSQVANGNFDLAITGRDWLVEHLYQFPSSPVKNLLNLGFGKVRVVVVVSQELPVDDVQGLRQLSAEWPTPLRVASEYIHIADKFARDSHLGHYRIVPTWGATESFLPDDADMLIENTQTGRTIARHKLKIIDTIFESTACLIGNTNNVSSSAKSGGLKSFVETLRTAAEEA
ncbi:ATP phosphoribosyltransferase [Chloroflexota bacterium]